MRMHVSMPRPNALGYLAAVDEPPVTIASYDYTGNVSGPEEAAAVQSVVQAQAAANQAAMSASMARMNAAADSASRRAQALNARLCAQPGWPYGCGASPCFSDAYRPGMTVGHGNPEDYRQSGYVGISCVSPGGGSRTWYAPDVPESVVIAALAARYPSPVGVTPEALAASTRPATVNPVPVPSTSGTGTTPTYMPGGFQVSATPNANYAGYLPPSAAAASAGGSNPVSTAGGVVGGTPPPPDLGVSPLVLAAAVAVALFFFQGGK
jgi:hypothetical protein